MQLWLHAFTAICGKPIQIPVSGGVQYQFKQEDEYTFCVAKAVRIVSGFNASLMLVDSGYIVEAGTLLRPMSDCSNDIMLIAQGMITKTATGTHKKIINDYFKTVPQDIFTYKQQQKERYVGRKELYCAYKKSADGMGIDGDFLNDLKKYIDKISDYYVHCGYSTSMELYNPNSGLFSVKGDTTEFQRDVFRKAIATKVFESLIAFEYIAKLFGLSDIGQEITTVKNHYETSSDYCN